MHYIVCTVHSFSQVFLVSISIRIMMRHLNDIDQAKVIYLSQKILEEVPLEVKLTCHYQKQQHICATCKEMEVNSEKTWSFSSSLHNNSARLSASGQRFISIDLLPSSIFCLHQYLSIVDILPLLFLSVVSLSLRKHTNIVCEILHMRCIDYG